MTARTGNPGAIRQSGKQEVSTRLRCSHGATYITEFLALAGFANCFVVISNPLCLNRTGFGGDSVVWFSGQLTDAACA